MERKNEDQKMGIEEGIPKIHQNNQITNIVPMEEEEKNIKITNPELGQKTQKNQTTIYSGELISSLATDCSNNMKSIETISSINKSKEILNIYKPKIPPIFKITVSKISFDCLYNTEYFDEIYTNLLLEEKNAKSKIDKDYMKTQIYINQKMRAILVDWLFEVHYRFHLKRKTLFQTIFIIDLFLSKKIIEKVKFQLLGIASLLIACKENEIFYPQIIEFVNITDNAYTVKELLNMEIYVLRSLNFEIFTSTSEEFYNILSKAFNFNRQEHFLGEYFLDSALIDYQILQYNSSVIAAACAYIVMKFSGLDGYKDLYSKRIILDENPQKAIKDCARYLCFLVKNLSNSDLKAVRDKYSSEEYCKVATLCGEQ